MKLQNKIEKTKKRIELEKARLELANCRDELAELRRQRWLKTPIFADLDDISLRAVIGKGFEKL